MDSSMAAVEPLPLVPAMWTQGIARCGPPRCSASVVILASPNFWTRACCGAASSRPKASSRRTASSYLISIQEKTKNLRDVGLQILAGNDRIQKTVLKQKLGRLETFGKFLTDGLLDDARPCKADHCARLSDIEVAQHGVARADPARGRIRQDGDERHARVIQTSQRGANFRELHQTHCAFHHSRACRAGDDDQGSLL